MSNKPAIGFFGGDQRQVSMAQTFLQMEYSILSYKMAASNSHENYKELHSLKELCQACQYLIGPIPLTNSEFSVLDLANSLTNKNILIGGVIPSDLADSCNQKGILYYDLMKNEKVAILNSIATAEGTIMEAIRNSDINLHGSNCLVLGYGRCGKVLSQKLKGMNASVTVGARSEEMLAFAEASGHQTIHLSDINVVLPNYDFIFNTIPAMVLDQKKLELVKQNVTIIDIASSPGGIDYKFALQENMKAKLFPGLPGKVSPKTSADILVNEIITLMKEGIR